MSRQELAVIGEEKHHPIPNPGIEEHVERYTDVDAAAGNRAYRQVVAMLAAVPVLSIAFMVIYFTVPTDMMINLGFLKTSASNLGLGLTSGLGVSLIGFAAVHWAKQLMGDAEIADERHSASSSAEDRQIALNKLEEGIEQSAIRRRPLLGGALAGALGFTALPAVVLLADMGPWPTAAVRKETIEKTLWAQGIRLVNGDTFAPIKASDLEVGNLVNAEPENLKELHHEPVRYQREKAKAPIIIVRMDPGSIKIPESRKDWHVGGILAYSKICTHVGCPVSLWERQTHHLLCPCHQSTFDLGDSGVVVFGPAARALPQLPITTDAEGYLIARSDFTVPVGPSYFERDSSNDFKEGDN